MLRYWNNKILHYFNTNDHHSTQVPQAWRKGTSTLTQTLSAVETSVAQNLIELESANSELKGFTISKVVEVPSANKGEKKSLIVFVPFHHQKALQANYRKLAAELEKRLKTVVLLVSTRTIESRWIKFRKSQKKPNSRTLTAVYDAILDDLLLPSIIIGKNTRVRLDGSSFTKIVLDRNDQPFLEDRVAAIKAAYKKLTTRDIEISFAQDHSYYTIPNPKWVDPNI